MMFIYILVSSITLIVSFLLFKKNAGTMSLLSLNLISFNFYYQLILQSFIGVNIVILGLDNHYMLNRITDINIKQKAYWTVILVLILIPLSMTITSNLLKFNSKKEWNQYVNSSIRKIISSNDKAIYFSLVIFTIISFLSIVYTFFNIGTIPILKMFMLKPEEVSQLRIQVSREFNGIPYIKNIFGLMLTPLLTYIAYVYKKNDNFIGWRILFYVLLFQSVLILSYDGSKSPLLIFILSFVFLEVLINGKIRVKKFIPIISLVIILILIMYLILFDYNSNFININSGPVGRILLGQIMGLYFHFQYFPHVIDFLGLNGFSSIVSKLFDIETVRSARIIMEMVNPKGIETGTAGVMNTLFIAEAYAAFGWWGVSLGTIYVGVVIQLIYITMLRLPKNPICLALFTYLTYSLPITGGFFEFIYNPGLIIVLVLFGIFYFLSRFIQKYFIKKSIK